MNIYDSLQIERHGEQMESRLFLRGGSIPETVSYTDFSTIPIVIGRNSDLGYDNRLWFNETCIVRMDYRYYDWEAMYRWIPKQY